MSANLKQLSELSKRGPHRVMEGDLGHTGLPGKVYAPAKGKDLPAVAFGHDWRRDIGAYTETLRHLASWGIVVAAPDTETGLSPDHAGFAADLETTLQILGGVRMGDGKITVSPGKLGLAGHGMGGGAAVLAAVGNDKVRAVAPLYPANVAPSAIEAARRVYVPGMIVGPGEDANSLFNPGNPAKLAYNWAGQVSYRTVKKATQQGFSKDGLGIRLLGLGSNDKKNQETTRALLTGFLLHKLADEKKYAAFSDAEATGKNVDSLIGADLAEAAGIARDDSKFSLF